MTKDSHLNLLKALISWTAVIVFLCVIFMLSAQSGTLSNNLSEGIVWTIQRFFHLHNRDGFDLNTVFRKLCHFTEFAVLALLVWKSFYYSGFSRSRSLKYTIGLCVFFAGMDEAHQIFVPDRAPRIFDVFIDSLGVCTGVITAFIATRIYLDNNEDSITALDVSP